MTEKEEYYKANFITYFDGGYQIEPHQINNPSTYSMGLTNLNYEEKTNTLTVHVRRPGVLIGKAGETLKDLKLYLDCIIKIVETTFNDNTKRDFLIKLKDVDINEDDWQHDLIDSLPNCYAKGFLNCKLETCNIDDNQELLEEITNWSSWTIWK